MFLDAIIIELSFVIVVYPIAAQIYIDSKCYINILSSLATNKFIQKEVKACALLKVYVGRHLYIKKDTGLKMCGYILYWTVKSILLATQRHS